MHDENDIMDIGNAINPEVMQYSAAIDEARVDNRSAITYYRNFWDSYKGHVRGMLAGIAIDGILGLGIGVALSFFLPISAWTLIASCSAGGALMGAEAFGKIGGAAASRASGLAEKHARLLDPVYEGNTLQALDDALMAGGHGHHYEFPRERDKGKYFSWKSGLVGFLVGSAIGAIALSAELFAHVAFLGSVVVNPLAGALVCGMIGATFGIDRSIFKSAFNQTDANVEGKLRFREKQGDRTCMQDLNSEEELAQHRQRRQDETNYLQKKYYNKLFWSGVSGMFRGSAGGLLLGALIGVAVGVMVFSGMALVGTTAVTAPGAFLTFASGFSALGGMLGMHVFDATGVEAGCESAARGIDDEFERVRALQQKGMVSPPAPKLKERLFNGKAMMIMAAIGAIGGVALAPQLLLHSMVAIDYVFAASLGALSGASFGIGMPIWKGIAKFTDKIYDTSYFRQSHKEDRVPEKQMGTSPSSFRPLRETSVTPQDMLCIDQKINRNRDGFGQAILTQGAVPNLPVIG